MKTYMKKILLCQIILFSSFAFGDNENYDGQDLTYGVFGVPGADKYEYRNSSWVGAICKECMFYVCDLSGANFTNADLTGAEFDEVILTNANFTNANLSNVFFGVSSEQLSGAVFTNAIIDNASFFELEKTQLYSTISYKNKNLVGVELRNRNNEIDGWDFNGHHLTDSQLSGNISNTNFNNASIINTTFDSDTIKNVDFIGANISNVNFSNASITGINFSNAIISDLSGGGYVDAIFCNSNIKGISGSFSSADFSGSIIDQMHSGSVNGSNFANTSISNSSFRGNVNRTDFTNTTLDNVEFSGLVYQSDFTNATLNNVSFKSLIETDLTDAIIENVTFSIDENFEREWLYSTKSYKDKNLIGITLLGTASHYIDLKGWDFEGQHFINAKLLYVTYIGNLKNAIIHNSEIIFAPISYDEAHNEGLFDIFYHENLDLRGTSILTYWPAGGAGGTPKLKQDSIVGQNIIKRNGEIFNFQMNNSEFSIHKYIPASEDGEMISAKLTEDAAMSGNSVLNLEEDAILQIYDVGSFIMSDNSTLNLEKGSILQIRNLRRKFIMSDNSVLNLKEGAMLEIADNAEFTIGEGASIILNTDKDSSTNMRVTRNSVLTFEKGSILEINLECDVATQDTLQIVLMDFERGSLLEGLDAFVKDETIFLNVNGSKWLGEWDYALENNQMILSVAIPEPSAFAAIFGALALGLALKFRNYKN